tara:strand:+ start:19 stop:504 length:486 start_codon:yes stop_codon:yes gene_type:complete
MNCRECGGTEFILFGKGGFVCKECNTPLMLPKTDSKKVNKKKASYETIEHMGWATNSIVRDMPCTIVLTPHFKKRWEQRCSHISKGTIIKMCMRIIETSNHNALNGTPLRDLQRNIIAYIYSKKIFNKQRKRWELELVSLTPSHVFQTHNTEEEVEWIEAE